MRTFTLAAFDEVLTGSAVTWYTSANYNTILGSADWIGVHAVTTDASGTSPTLTCQIEHSGDARNWVSVQGTPEIDHQAVLLGQENTFSGAIPTLLYPPLLKFVRIKLFLGGTAPQCRLKLHITGRAFHFMRDPNRMAIGAPGMSAAQAGPMQANTETYAPSGARITTRQG